ncbi:MAG: hypothetical protein ACOCXT_02735 [Candidatus Dojkabacteria bacterium]
MNRVKSRKKLHTHHISLFTLLVFSFAFASIIYSYRFIGEQQVVHAEEETQSDQVVVRGKVNFDPSIKVYPEKRVPVTNNWANKNVIHIREAGTTQPLITQVVETASTGEGQMQEVDVSILPPGTYEVLVKGVSHLQKNFNQHEFIAHKLWLDLTLEGEVLLAGDTSVVEDNYVNSLDLSNTIRFLYRSDSIRNDLNRDGTVNSLDISNEITNLYLTGDE